MLEEKRGAQRHAGMPAGAPVLVVGGSAYLGRHLARDLLECGCEGHVLDLSRRDEVGEGPLQGGDEQAAPQRLRDEMTRLCAPSTYARGLFSEIT
jgi:NAD(P)-dependent dehydrogenase (short-subunit alcohol dehydrogenase family)